MRASLLITVALLIGCHHAPDFRPVRFGIAIGPTGINTTTGHDQHYTLVASDLPSVGSPGSCSFGFSSATVDAPGRVAAYTCAGSAPATLSTALSQTFYFNALGGGSSGTSYFPTEFTTTTQTTASSNPVKVITAVKAGTLQRLMCSSSQTSAPTGGAAITMMTWVGSFPATYSATTMTCTIGSGSNTCNDVTHTPSVAQGDLFILRLVLSNAYSGQINCQAVLQ